MFIHLAGDLSVPVRAQAVVYEQHPSSLLSFAYAPTERTWARVWNGLLAEGIPPRIMIDSGAFTAHTLGKVYTPRDYAAWAEGFGERWGAKLADLNYMNLDVIGDQAATWRNQSALEKLGLTPMPIVTFGAQMKDLRRALDGYDYIALGGLVPYTRQKAKLRGWLDTCFRQVMAQAERQGSMPRVHLLGVTTEWVLERYPAYSTDSSSFLASLRYGQSPGSGLPSVPRGGNKATDAENAASRYALRMEVRRVAAMQARTTAIWNRRGVSWGAQSIQAS